MQELIAWLQTRMQEEHVAMQQATNGTAAEWHAAARDAFYETLLQAQGLQLEKDKEDSLYGTW